MLTNLSVQNFALFDKLVVDFQPGFNVLTGETGAGKSILIDAFNIALGGKASVGHIRSGEDFLTVQAVFDISSVPAAQRLLDEQGIDYREGELILFRKITAAGKNISAANGIRITAGVLRTLGDILVDVHGQYENQQLLKEETYLGLLDSYAGGEIERLLNEYAALFAALKDAGKKLKLNKETVVERERTLDILSWEIEEIEKASLKIGEEQLLTEKHKRLANREKLTAALSASYSIIEGENTGYSGLIAHLGRLNKELSIAARYDDKMAAALKTVSDIEYSLSDLKTELAVLLDDQEPPDMLETVEERLDVVYKLKKKYGSDIADILNYCSQAKEKKKALLRIEEDSEQLRKQEAYLGDQAEALSRRLNACRRKAAQIFAEQTLVHIRDLSMEQARFAARVTEKDQLGDKGRDDIHFLFSANAGQELKPLGKIASGGELSRVALAIKTVLMGKTGLPTMVFDEIDTGVGGKTAQKMAEKLAIIACRRQVLSITHLPQIACMADNHIYIDKKQDDRRTWIEIKILDEEERINELTRMVAGDNQTRIARDNARQMLELAKDKKARIRNGKG
jgi:DNA repair protein RecN (Recombination protein N)